jgi:two-component system, OmpR family, phosphate regulon response regulator PhoB
MSDAAILIVDDDADLRDLIRFVVEPTGVAVVDAADCREAIAVLQAHRDRIRLVLLDYFMPGADPTSCARALCDMAGPERVVLCTAAADPAGRAAEIGLSRWLAKPFALETLESLVRDATRSLTP